MPEPISAERIQSQSWKFYFVLFAWPAYLFLLPLAFSRLGVWALIAVVFPGLYLFAWLGFLMHETWHKYVPQLPNGILYNLFSWMLLTDPQLYRLVHGFHHSKVNSFDDTEFHPLGEIRSRGRRIGNNVAEIFLGILFLVALTSHAVPRHPRYKERYRYWRLALSVLIWAGFLGGLGYASHMIFAAGWKAVAASYFVSYFLGSLLLHHSQLAEHGNLIVDGDWNQRNIRTRNLSPKGFAARTFLFFTHGDSREHVLHHTLTPVYSRPFPGQVPMPEHANVITLGEYARILGDMLLGRPSPR